MLRSIYVHGFLITVSVVSQQLYRVFAGKSDVTLCEHSHFIVTVIVQQLPKSIYVLL